MLGSVFVYKPIVGVPVAEQICKRPVSFDIKHFNFPSIIATLWSF